MVGSRFGVRIGKKMKTNMVAEQWYIPTFLCSLGFSLRLVRLTWRCLAVARLFLAFFRVSLVGVLFCALGFDCYGLVAGSGAVLAKHGGGAVAGRRLFEYILPLIWQRFLYCIYLSPP